MARFHALGNIQKAIENVIFMWLLWDLPSDKLRYLLNMAIEIVSFPMTNGDFPSFFVCLPSKLLFYQRVPECTAEKQAPCGH